MSVVARALGLVREGKSHDAIGELEAYVGAAGGKSDGRAWGVLGEAYRSIGQPEKAVDAFRRSVKLLPYDGALWGTLAELQQALGRVEDAKKSYGEAMRLLPSNHRLAVHLGIMQLNAGRQAAAIENLKRAYALAPDDPVVVANLMAALNRSGPVEEALAFARKFAGLAVTPPFVTEESKWAAMGVALGSAGMLVESHEAFAKVVAASGDKESLRLERGFIYMAQGDYQKGYELLQSRLIEKVLDHDLVVRVKDRLWKGEDVRGKRMLVLGEQGAGDVVQFVRYVPELVKRGAVVQVRCAEGLVELVKTAGDFHVVGLSSTWEDEFDLAVLMGDLPYLLGMSNELLAEPYLKLDAARVEKMQRRLGPRRKKLRVGVCWSGNPKQPINPRRAMDPKLLKELMVEGVELVSLQKVVPVGQVVPKGVVDITKDVSDFADSAALMACMDVVITTDTSIAHVAGSMGMEAWVMLHGPVPHWPYGLSGERCGWYPSLRLFRQETPGDWNNVVQRVVGELRGMIANRV